MADVPVTYQNTPLSTPIGTTSRIDFSSDLTLDHESEVPLLTLISKLESENVDSYMFKYAVGRQAPRYTLADGGEAAGAVGASTTINVDEATYFVAGDVVEVPDDHNDATHTNQLIVLSVDESANTITCKAYINTLGTCLIDDNDVIRVLFSALPEGSSGRYSRQTVPTVYTNYVQTFEDYFDVTRLQARQAQYTDPERTRLREEVRKKHAIDQEYALFFAKGCADVATGGTYGGSSTKPRYQLSGLFEQVTTGGNALTYGAVLAEDELFGFMTDVHNPAYSGGNKRLVLASGDLLEQVNNMASAAIRITTKDTTWGPNITEVQFAGKVWQFIEAPILTAHKAGSGVVVHPGYMKKRVFWATTYEMNVQNPIDKFYKDGFYTVMSMEVRLAEIFGIIKVS